MKKKLVCILICVLLVVGAVCTLVACGPKNDAHTLNIVVLDKGYGTDWIKPLIEKFKADNPGYDVKLDASADASKTITNHINSRNNIDDLYISVGADWLTYATKGLLAELDDIMDDQVDGMTLKEKVATEYQSSVLYPNVKTGELHTYRLPWISGTGGIFYNKKMFAKYGWEVPTTFDKLKELCDQIAAENIKDEQATSKAYVKPFVYTGQNTDYFDYAVYTWWAQMAGEQAIKDFTSYSAASNFDTSNATYGYLKDAVDMWYQLIGNDNYVNRDICKGASNYDAQNAFVQGRAAMMFNGDWIYNETLPLISDFNKDTFELGFMPLPAVRESGVDKQMLYTVGEDQWIGVPNSSIKKDLAKKFIKIMVSDFGCKTFLQKANGLLAYKCNYQEEDLTNDFLKELVNNKNACTKPFTDYPKDMSGNIMKSNKLMYLTHNIHNFWGQSAWRPFEAVLNGKTVEAAFAEIKNNVASNWNSWQKNCGLA